jgi:hypothetical protein
MEVDTPARREAAMDDSDKRSPHPLLAALSTALAVAAMSRGRIDAWRARRHRGHV